MAAPPSQDSDTEFGYDFSPEDEEALIQLVSPTVVKSRRPLVDSVATDTHIADDGSVTTARGYYVQHSIDNRAPTDGDPPFPAGGAPASPVSLGDDVVQYPDCTALELAEARRQKDSAPVDRRKHHDGHPKGDGNRSPLERFRTYPKKPLTVSDLTSGAWCELQYEYTLTRLPGGRRTRTAAMREGSKVHRKLEDEVHTTVKVDIMTREDGFGLRLWNLVQGLRTLRDTGLTRELEVWGMVDGNVVNGVIDVVSYENPNPQFESELAVEGFRMQSGSNQSVLSDYFPTQSRRGTPARRKIYLGDVKTRGSLRPVSSAVLRPAKIQLLLYHSFLGAMAAGELDYTSVARRYGLDVDEPFSDIFLAEIGGLHDEMFYDADDDRDDDHDPPPGSGSSQNSDVPPPSILSGTPQPGPDLLRYRTIRELLRLVSDEVCQTFPEGRDSLGYMLRIQYVHRNDGSKLESHDFPVSKIALDEYLAKYMSWWRGERPAVGISDVEEAFKCRTCEFAEGCEWRDAMDRDLVSKARAKMRARG
ncbi:exonuclease V [Geosmithia morbida]|uniref:Exonuclease V n=1 Tax=Geosmithia morbida TaxID=1094350 RepID=A0A9P5D9W0_9HYPO|nr:exonuclease V [Geosmithia morbida]KAF4126934.1 exonuclease V [Geosmithia morbida]